MASVKIPQYLLEKLELIAQRKQRPVEDVLIDILEQVSLPQDSALPPVNLDDLPRDEDGMNGVEFAALPFRQKLYKMARRYWRETGNTQRLALTDEELDEQFWLFDGDGVPRLKSEQGNVEIPHDPFDSLIGLFADSDITDASTTVHETLEDFYQAKYGSSD